MRFRTVRLKSIICAMLSGAMILTLATPVSAATARATTMKLEKTEGTVTLKTQNGSARKIIKGMRLYNGNTLATAKYSYAHISLDSTKAVKLDQSSSATLRQSGKQLELLVKSGKLFFNVSKKLSSNESMNVRTSTMVTGIRGTCGVVEYVDVNKSKLYLIEGKVTLGSGNNATTVYGGQTATVVLRPKQETGGSEQPGGGDKPGETDKEMGQKVMVETLTEKQIPPVALQEIVADPILQEKIEQTTELKIEKIEEALEQFEKEEAERIEQEKAEQEKEEEKDQEKEQDEKKEDENTTSSGGGSYTPSTPAPTSATLSGTVSAAAINAALVSYSKVTVATVGKDADGNQVETSVTLEDKVAVPAGKVLIMETGKVKNGNNLSCGEGTLIDRGSVSGITDSALLSIDSDATVYAKEFYPRVADYLNEYAQKSLSVSVDFKKNAIVKSNITLQPASGSQQTIQWTMNGNTLEIQSGTLTLASDVSILGSSSNALVLLSGGNLILQGISKNGNVNIQNTGSGATISRTAGTVTWNDTGLGIANKNGAQWAIDGASAPDDMVKIPDWVVVKTGYVAVWKDNMLTLEPTQSDFTSGTVTLADLNRALSANQTVTIGADANVTLQSQEYLTIPCGKTLIVQSKINGNESTGYTYGFKMESGSVLTVDDKATLKVSGAIGLNGTVNVGSNEGATLLVDTGVLLQVDKINLTSGSTVTNNGTIDSGALASAGNCSITNTGLIKLKETYTVTGTAKDKYDGKEGSAVVTGGESTAMPNASLLAVNSDQNMYCYASQLNANVAAYMNNKTWMFSKDAIVPSTANGITLTNFSAEMGANKLEVQGALTVSGTAIISGSGEKTIYLNGGTVTLRGIAADSQNLIENTNEAGFAIARGNSGNLIWDDTSMAIIARASVKNGVTYVVQGATSTGTTVNPPDWVSGAAAKIVQFDVETGKIYVYVPEQ